MKKGIGKKSKTHRGFALVEFKDAYGDPCSLQQSSLATANALWLGRDKVAPKVLVQNVGWVEATLPDGATVAARMHLTESQVRGLIVRLQKWLDTGAF